MYYDYIYLYIYICVTTYMYVYIYIYIYHMIQNVCVYIIYINMCVQMCV